MMELEELKAEAEKLGYKLVKKTRKHGLASLHLWQKETSRVDTSQTDQRIFLQV